MHMNFNATSGFESSPLIFLFFVKYISRILDCIALKGDRPVKSEGCSHRISGI